MNSQSVLLWRRLENEISEVFNFEFGILKYLEV